ncbi:submaxillary mucin-like protein [Lytechinus variegatus]|uniref:submaxillary mucin-like protein n=1 Tax=Lytechinus variegatus TaxID=7654 RepID=UPI001BB1B366|nr:submaxillary mucin-like protein [Lytechinus variegatus]
MSSPANISYNGCIPIQPIYLEECAGTCDSSYSMEIVDGQLKPQSYCTCCQPNSVTEQSYEASCPDGSIMTISVPVITSCTCNPMDCPTKINFALFSPN